jgi:hypothetical protein
LLISHGIENAVGCGAEGGDSLRGPEAVDFGEEGGDLTPTCPFAGFARFAYEDDEEIETMTGGANQGMRLWTSEVTESGEELQKDGHGIGFAMWGKATKGEAGNTMEGEIGQRGRLGGRGFGFVVWRRLGTRDCLLFPGILEREGSLGPCGRLRLRIEAE